MATDKAQSSEHKSLPLAFCALHSPISVGMASSEASNIPDESAKLHSLIRQGVGAIRKKHDEPNRSYLEFMLLARKLFHCWVLVIDDLMAVILINLVEDVDARSQTSASSFCSSKSAPTKPVHRKSPRCLSTGTQDQTRVLLSCLELPLPLTLWQEQRESRIARWLAWGAGATEEVEDLRRSRTATRKRWLDRRAGHKR